MKRETKLLSLLTSVLFIISVFVYVIDNRRQAGPKVGTEFLDGFSVSSVYKITHMRSAEELFTLEMDGNAFVLKNMESYPALTQKVNDLLYELGRTQIVEMASASKSSFQELELSDEKPYGQFIVYDKSGKELFNFYIGKMFKNIGRYARFKGSDEVYLIDDSPTLSSISKYAFIDQMILKEVVKVDEIESIVIDSQGRQEEILAKVAPPSQDQDGKIIPDQKSEQMEFQLVGDSGYQSQKLRSYVSAMTTARYNSLKRNGFSAILNSKPVLSLTISSKNKLKINIFLYKIDESYYATFNALIDQAANQIEISKDDGEEKYKEVQEMVDAQKALQSFNKQHDGWVYEFEKNEFEKFHFKRESK